MRHWCLKYVSDLRCDCNKTFLCVSYSVVSAACMILVLYRLYLLKYAASHSYGQFISVYFWCSVLSRRRSQTCKSSILMSCHGLSANTLEFIFTVFFAVRETSGLAIAAVRYFRLHPKDAPEFCHESESPNRIRITGKLQRRPLDKTWSTLSRFFPLLFK